MVPVGTLPNMFHDIEVVKIHLGTVPTGRRKRYRSVSNGGSAWVQYDDGSRDAKLGTTVAYRVVTWYLGTFYWLRYVAVISKIYNKKAIIH